MWDVATGECLGRSKDTRVRSTPWRSRPTASTAVSASRPRPSACGTSPPGNASARSGTQEHDLWRGAHARRADGRLRQLTTRPSACGTSPAGDCLRTLEGHTNRVTDVALTPDGHTAVSASDDDTLRVWDVATWGLPSDARRDTRFGRRRGTHARWAHGHLRQ